MNTFATNGGGVQDFLLNTSDFVFINDQRRCSERQVCQFKEVNHLCFCIEHLLWSFMNTKSGVLKKKFHPEVVDIGFVDLKHLLPLHLWTQQMRCLKSVMYSCHQSWICSQQRWLTSFKWTNLLFWAPPLVIYEHKIRGVQKKILNTSSVCCKCVHPLCIFCFNFV